MNFFKTIWTAIVGFFKSPSGQKIIKNTVSILKEISAEHAEPLAKRALDAVKRAQREGGDDKYERVFKELRGYFTENMLDENSINLAIEATLAALKKEIQARGIEALQK